MDPFMYAAFVKYTSPIIPRAKIAIPTHIGITKNIPYLYEAVTYIFDLADTGAKQDSAPVLIWQYNDLYAETVTVHLEKVFGVSGNKGITEQLIRIALQLADTYWNDNKHAIISSMKGSLMEELDELNTGIRFRNSAAVSIAFVLLSRCNLEMKGYFEREDFRYLCEFNSKAAAIMLGTAVRDCSELVLRQIERVIKAHQNGECPNKTTILAFPDVSRTEAVTTDQIKEQGVEDTQVSSTPVAISEPVISLPEKEKIAAKSTPTTLPKVPTEDLRFPATLPMTIRAENYHIIDDNLGVGGPKAKFQMNMAAIRLLKALESEGRQATHDGQDVL